MNPYKLDLEKWIKKSKAYFGFRLALWFVSVYGTVWGIIGTTLYLIWKRGI